MAAVSVLPAASQTALSPEPASAFSTESVPDIIGLNTLMNAAQATAAINQYFRGRKLDVSTLYRPKSPTKGDEFVAQFNYGINYSASTTTGETVFGLLSSSASKNRLVYIFRDVNFADTQRPDPAATIKSVTDKYGAPSLLGYGSLIYFWKDGKLLAGGPPSGGQTTMQAASSSMPDGSMLKQISKTADIIGCHAASINMHALGSKSLDQFYNLSNRADCDAMLKVQLSTIPSSGRLARMTFVLIDFKALKSAALIDREADKVTRLRMQNALPMAPPPKL